MPTASDGAREHADWLEAAALLSREGCVSMEMLVSIIRRGGSVDAFESEVEDYGDRGSEISQRIGNDAFAELQARATACNGRYPFAVTQGLLSVDGEAEKSIYVLLLLLSGCAPTSGHKGTAALFERICTDAAREYLGGALLGVNALRFGAPRPKPQVKLHEAIDHLCRELGEGGGCAHEAKARHKGDAGLDLVAWKHFPDKKAGKLIAFGQCAGGSTAWDLKVNELDGAKFAKKWLREAFAVDPIRMFFLPRWVDSENWRDTGVDAGIVFDRGRIAAFSATRDDKLVNECEQTTKKLLKDFRGS